MLMGDPGCQWGRALLWRMQLPARVSFAHTVTLLMMLQSHVSEGLMQSLDANFWSQLKDLMVLFRNFTRNTLTFIAIVEAAGTIPSTALNQETAWPEDGICSLQFFPNGHREVPRCTAVESHFLFEKVEVHHFGSFPIKKSFAHHLP